MKKMRFAAAAAAGALLALSGGSGADGFDTPEPGSREAIAAATTEPRFASPWVADVPASATVPSPTRFLGHIAGAPGELTRTAKIYAYYRALAAATPRVRVETLGKSEEGREMLLVLVGENLSAAEALRADMAALADPRRTDEAAMERIVAHGRPFYWLQGGLHSTETGSPEMLMELAYRLAVSEDPRIRGIRERLVVLINPVAEPDGRDRAVDWFYRHLKGKTDWENLSLDLPYWGKYVAHDNNRDLIQRRLALTQASEDGFLRWHPIVFHDLHESVPLLSIWTGTGPYNANLDPIATTEWHTIAFHEVTEMTALGMPGVWTWGFGEGFSQIYADSVATNHNAIGRGYETFGNGTAETIERVLEPDDEQYTGRPVTDPDWYRTLPPPKKFRWSLRNNTNYMETGVLAALEYTASNASSMMRNFWRRGRNAVKKGETEKPYAIVIPESPRDRGRLAALVDLLRAHGIEVSRAKEAIKVSDGNYPAGTFVVRMDQPYRGYALDLLTAQKYPIDKALYPPYDDVAWSLPHTFGVEVKTIDDPAIRNAPVEAVAAPVTFPGSVEGKGPVYLLADTGQEALLEARIRLAGFRVEAAEKAFSSGGRDFPAGSWVIAAQDGLAPVLQKTAADLGLDFRSAAAAPSVPKHELDFPRLAVLQTWNDTQSAGWVRMIFDERKIPYTLIEDEDVRAGKLGSRFDVILFPNTYQSLKSIVGGIDPKFSPLAYTRTDEFPSHGSPTSSPDITGGLTWGGVGNLEEFVRGGGLLVTLGGASTLALDGGIARDVSRAGVKVDSPGSELTARFRRPDHPIAYGYPEITSVFRENRPVYRVRRPDEGKIVLQWGAKIPKDDDAEKKEEKKDKKPKEDEPELVVSGGLKGGSDLSGKPAILDLPTGKGRVLAFEFDPIHRYMTRSDFRLVWNAILDWNDLPPTPPAAKAAAPKAR
jgi:hypothetical protein